MKRGPFEEGRYFLKDSIRLAIDFSQTDQNRGSPPPPIEKPFDLQARRIPLIPRADLKEIPKVDIVSAIGNRRSHRIFTSDELTLEEISFLLWATQGIRRMTDGGSAYRTVPSAGCRHAIETYLCLTRSMELEAGVYRYLPLEHELLLEFQDGGLPRKLVDATLGQSFIGTAPVVFVWTTIPYRMEWRYHRAAHKVIALDAGHVGQNLYLACEAIGAGTCAVAAYNQDLMDRLVRVDGDEEFVTYLAPVGKVAGSPTEND